MYSQYNNNVIIKNKTNKYYEIARLFRLSLFEEEETLISCKLNGFYTIVR
jgi:hypothetical protein